MRAKDIFDKGVSEKHKGHSLMPLHPTRVAPPPPPNNRNIGTLNGNNRNTGHNNNGPQIYTQTPTVIRTIGSNKVTKKKVPPPRPEPPKNYKQPIYGFNNNITSQYTERSVITEQFNFTKSNGSYRKRIAPIPSPIRAQIQLKNKLKESLIDLDTPNSSPKHSASILDLPNPSFATRTLLDMENPDIPQPSLLPPLLPLQQQRGLQAPKPFTNGFSSHSNMTTPHNPSPGTSLSTKKDTLFPDHVEVNWPNPEPSVFNNTKQVTTQNIAYIKPQSSRSSSSLKNEIQNIASGKPQKSLCFSSPKDESNMLIALYDYSSDMGDDLEFKEGDKIKFLGEINSDWWLGECNGRQGQFPSNFVEVVESIKPLPITEPVKHNEKQESTQLSKPIIDQVMTALYDFPADQEGDLELKVGDQVNVLEKINDEWYYGECGGIKGQFPSNFVEPTPTPQKKPAPTSPTLGFVIAMYDFSKEQETDLELKAGDKILVTEHIDSNWWRGMAVKDDREGTFPAAFVERLE